MDTRRFVTITKAALVQFLDEKLNDEEMADLWANVGETVNVGVGRPSWKLPTRLDHPTVVIQKVGSTTELSNVSQNQAIVEGYWKDMVFEVHCCTDDATGGRVTVDDLSSAVEYVLANYSEDLHTEGILLWQFDDATETDEASAYENIATVTLRVLVPGAEIEPAKMELGRFQFTSSDFGHFYPGTVLDEAQDLEIMLVNSTSGTTASCQLTCRNQLGVLKTLNLSIPMATAKGTILTLTGGTPGDKYVSVTAVTVTGGQAGYLFAVYNKVGG